MQRIVAVCFWLLVAESACADLPTIQSGSCGNGVVEQSAGEDCDTFAAAPGSVCRPPGDSQQCRYDCTARTDGSRPACPSGMNCATDDVCRWGSGSFASTPVSIPAASHELLVADVDGDRRQDLIVAERGRTRVEYFRDGDVLDDELEIASSTQTGAYPAVGQLSGDTLSDVAVSVGSGVLVDLGTRDRSPATVAYDSIALPSSVSEAYFMALRVLSQTPGEGLLLVLTAGTTVGALAYISSDVQVQPLTLTFYAPKDLAGEILIGNIEDDPVESPCDDLILPFTGADHLVEYSPCRRDPAKGIVLNTNATGHYVTLADGATVLGPAVLFDADGDGHEDVAVVGTRNDTQSLQIAYGLGDGTFNSSTPVPAVGDGLMSTVATLGSAKPLAIADFDRDGFLDYVDANGAYVHRSSGWETATIAPVPWSTAVIADLNGNGQLDVFAATQGGSGATFLNGAGDGAFAEFSVASSAPLSHLRVGDFDGDLIDDVAASEATPAGDALSVLFGQAAGAPGTAQRMGLLDHVLQVVPSPRLAVGGVTYAVGSILALSQTDSGELAIAGFQGRGDRDLRSPFVVTLSEGATSNVKEIGYPASRVAIGDFDGDGHGDFAQVGVSTETAEVRLWLVPSEGNARIPLSAYRSSDPLPVDRDWSTCMLAAGDLDGDGTDETVLIAPALAGTGSQAWIARSVDSGDGHRTWQLGSPVDLDQRFAQVEAIDAQPGDPAGGRIKIADLDADGHVDVVALAPAFDNQPPALVVFHGSGKRALGAPTVVPDTPAGPPTAFALVQADRDPALELALLANGSVYIADALGGKWHVGKTPVAKFVGATLITAGDFDGDGADDLALATATSVELFPGVPGLR